MIRWADVQQAYEVATAEGVKGEHRMQEKGVLIVGHKVTRRRAMAGIKHAMSPTGMESSPEVEPL